jgi:hypothetical protein
MGGTSSLDLMTRRFESGMPRLVLQLAIPLEGHTYDWVAVRRLLSRWAAHRLWI